MRGGGGEKEIIAYVPVLGRCSRYVIATAPKLMLSQGSIPDSEGILDPLTVLTLPTPVREHITCVWGSLPVAYRALTNYPFINGPGQGADRSRSLGPPGSPQHPGFEVFRDQVRGTGSLPTMDHHEMGFIGARRQGVAQGWSVGPRLLFIFVYVPLCTLLVRRA